MLGPLLCGLLAQAPLLPKLRGHFAEFLDNASPAGLGILSLSACVGLRYGYMAGYSGFSWRPLRLLRYFGSLRLTLLAPARYFPRAASRACTGFPSPGQTSGDASPLSSAAMQYRILHLLSIGYALRPRLRSRLPRGRSALPRKPWTSGLGDSHPHLATHSGILSSRSSTAPSGAASPERQCSPTKESFCFLSRASAACFSPGHFRRRASRPVSYYALFQCMAASEPTSWLSLKSHILFHLTRTLGP